MAIEIGTRSLIPSFPHVAFFVCTAYAVREMKGYHQSNESSRVQSIVLSPVLRPMRCRLRQFQHSFVLSSQHAMSSNKAGNKEEEEEAAGVLPLDVEALTISSKEPMCASCGKSEDEQGKLKTCTACKSVKYCSVDCQRNHRKAHKKECKRIEKQLKGAGGLGGPLGQYSNLSVKASDEPNDNEDLFKSPPREECPLCLITQPLRNDETTYMSCCGKRICDGCSWKHGQVLGKMNAERALDDPPKPPLQSSCAFCRKPTPTSDEEAIERVENRMALGDSEAFDVMGGFYEHGKCGLARDERREFELRLRAAELGSANGCYNVSVMYSEGIGVARDISKEEYYLKLAAKRGHIPARHNLGSLEGNRGNYQVAVKHWMISATAGDDLSTQNIGMAYRKKYATKDQYEIAIRLCKDVKEEMSSEERDKARAARASGDYS